MKLYCGIELHSNNSYLVALDEQDHAVYKRRLRNDLKVILSELSPFKDQIVGIAVESTFNWYWLVDGLMAAGYRVHLANPAAMQQYKGLNHMLRLGVLPEGYIYPPEERATNILSLQNLVHRNTGQRLGGPAWEISWRRQYC